MKLEPRFCRGYVDDVFVLFESSESAYSFHKNGKFVTSVYIKPTFTGVYTKYDSFIPTYQMRGPLHNYFIAVLAYVVISRHFILNLII